ncbi:Uncharacterised protein [uncultured archaeon]|nr:Uncharacterised protein [uncultured archaeon]
MEEKALVLDYMARGRSSDIKTEPMAQLIGKAAFTLLEVVPRPGVEFKSLDEVYVGKDERPQIDHIKKRLDYKGLTNNSLNELEGAIQKIVLSDEAKYIAFYNTSRSISLKMHQIELLPGMGKKHMLQLLGEREKMPFTSFEEMKKRLHPFPDPVAAIVKRVAEELEGKDQKFYLFTRPPSQEKEFRHGMYGGHDRRDNRDRPASYNRQ